ncbi:MAG: MerR family transcriptional regulator [Bdellovibrionales bacterium]|nr:MerR family transcriptional regulator [Bdellovibrionales bacterium]
MAYTVKKLAQWSGVSVRTLHFYDEIGLLKPARVTENGYRHYDKPELLRLQQILFYRELGFELKKIQEILSDPAFDSIQALKQHRKTLTKDLERTGKLIETIDKTLADLKKGKKMKDHELFQGFDPKKQKQYEYDLVNRYGNQVKSAITESKAKTAKFTKADWARVSTQWESILSDLSVQFKKGSAPDSKAVQAVVERHFRWLHRFWTPTAESYAGLGQGYTAPEWSKAFQAHDNQHPRLASFLADAIQVFSKGI